MTRTKKIIYWVSTIWLALGMVATGLVQLAIIHQEASYMKNLNYPAYVMPLLGVWKLLGAVAILVPRFPLLKEWAYAGLFFAMTGAGWSHIASGTADQIYPSILLLSLTIVSWYSRPADRKVALTST